MLTLQQAKDHLRVEVDDDDNVIVDMIEAATAAIADYLNTPLEDLPAVPPSPVKAAALLLVADLYENREGQTDRQLYQNPTFERLLNPYRVMT